MRETTRDETTGVIKDYVNLLHADIFKKVFIIGILCNLFLTSPYLKAGQQMKVSNFAEQ